MAAARDSNVTWLFANKFAGQYGVRHGILASVDGILLGEPIGALSDDDGERLAAVAATVVGASRSIPRAFDTDTAGDGNPHIVIRAGERNYLIVPISDVEIAILFVDGTTDLAMLAYEVAQFGLLVPPGFFSSH